MLVWGVISMHSNHNLETFPVSPPSTWPSGRKNCRPPFRRLKKTFTFTMTFQILALHYKNAKISTEIYSYSTWTKQRYHTISFHTLSPSPSFSFFFHIPQGGGDGGCGGCGGPRHLQGDWYWLFEAACLSRPVVAFAAMSWWEGKVSLPRVFGCFCWLKENTKFRKGERLGKSGKDLKIYSWLIGSSYRICRWFGCCICWCIPINKYICSCVCMCAWDRRCNNTYYTYLSADCA